MRKGNVLPIALMALAIVGFLLMVDYSIGGGKWPWSTENTNKVTQKTTNTTANANVYTNTTTNVNVSTNTNTPTNVNTSTNTNIATSPTANWKTYTNETYKYSIKYPETYAKITTPNGDVSVRFDKGKMNTVGYQFLVINVITNTSDIGSAENSVYQWAKNGFSFTAPITAYHQNPRREKLGQETIVVTDGDLGSSGIPEYLLFKNNLLYSISSYSGNSSQATNRELIATMTFPDPTADWKTYTDTSFGYSFKYPPTYSEKETDSLPYFDSLNGQIAIRIFDRVLDPNNIQGLYGDVDSGRITKVKLGTQDGYQYTSGDGGCGGPWIQTSIGKKIINVQFTSCEGDTEPWLSKNESLRSTILSTFTFTK
jgi:hypothetical protein